MFRDRVLKRVLLERFIVTPISGPTFSALLAEVDSTTFRFVDVSVVEPGVTRPAQGELFIARSNIAYLQRMAAKE